MPYDIVCVTACEWELEARRWFTNFSLDRHFLELPLSSFRLFSFNPKTISFTLSRRCHVIGKLKEKPIFLLVKEFSAIKN